MKYCPNESNNNTLTHTERYQRYVGILRPFYYHLFRGEAWATFGAVVRNSESLINFRVGTYPMWQDSAVRCYFGITSTPISRLSSESHGLIRLK